MRFKRLSIFESAKTSNVSKIALKKFQICLFLRWCFELIVGCQKICYYCESYVTFFSFYFIHWNKPGIIQAKCNWNFQNTKLCLKICTTTVTKNNRKIVLNHLLETKIICFAGSSEVWRY